MRCSPSPSTPTIPTPSTPAPGTCPGRRPTAARNWSSIKKGLIDDSDVFSMIVDLSRPSVLFASACSGIYRTDDGGAEFRKVQGIPSTARRTRVLKMDPADRNTVYAGTTEGLYKTTDGGNNWTRLTAPDVIVNDVYVDPRNPKHLLLATDRGGVLASEDARRDLRSLQHRLLAAAGSFSSRRCEEPRNPLRRRHQRQNLRRRLRHLRLRPHLETAERWPQRPRHLPAGPERRRHPAGGHQRRSLSLDRQLVGCRKWRIRPSAASSETGEAYST